VFKLSTDSARLLAPTKNFRSGATPGRRHKWGCFSVFMA